MRISDALFRAPIPAHRPDEYARVQLVVAPAFGSVHGEGPGESNRQLADETERLLQDAAPRRRAIVQTQVYHAFTAFGMNYTAHVVHSHHLDTLPYAPIAPLNFLSKWSRARRYVDTYEVFWQTADFIRTHQLPPEIILACHPDHRWRCYHSAVRLGLKVYVADVGTTPYDPHCDQWETRSRARWLAYDRWAGLWYALRGLI